VQKRKKDFEQVSSLGKKENLKDRNTSSRDPASVKKKDKLESKDKKGHCKKKGGGPWG